MTAPPRRVFLVVDDAKLRSALRLLLENEEGLAVVGESRDCGGLVALADAVGPDLVLLSWSVAKAAPAGLVARPHAAARGRGRGRRDRPLPRHLAGARTGQSGDRESGPCTGAVSAAVGDSLARRTERSYARPPTRRMAMIGTYDELAAHADHHQ